MSELAARPAEPVVGTPVGHESAALHAGISPLFFSAA